MKKLYLLRHAEAESAAPASTGDHERLLTPHGQAQARALGERMRADGVFPDFVLSSSSVRTLQTVRIVFGHIMNCEGQVISSHFDRALYLAPADTLLQHIRLTPDEVENLLVVAHNPGVAELCHALGGDSLPIATAGVPPGTMATFGAEIGSWNDLSPATVRLEDVFAP